MIRKLKYEHIKLTPFSKMRVDLAAQVMFNALFILTLCNPLTMFLSTQVLSDSVSKGLLLVCGEEASETARFVSMADRFFDALNVHNYSHGVRSLKPFQLPYTSSADMRLKVNSLQYYPCNTIKSVFHFIFCIYFAGLVVGNNIFGIFAGMGELCNE